MAGIVLVAIGEGVLMDVVYLVAGLPHPILFGVTTAVAAMIPFAAAFVIGLAAFVLLGGTGIGPAIGVVSAGAAVVFVADHVVRPKVIGGAAKLPFLWVLLGIVEESRGFSFSGSFWAGRHGGVDAVARAGGAEPRYDAALAAARSLKTSMVVSLLSPTIGIGRRRGAYIDWEGRKK